jgi:hypothetical protein
VGAEEVDGAGGDGGVVFGAEGHGPGGPAGTVYGGRAPYSTPCEVSDSSVCVTARPVVLASDMAAPPPDD